MPMLLPILQTHNVSGKVLRYRTSPSWHTVCAVNRQLHFRAQIKTNSNCPQNNPSCLHRKHFGGGGDAHPFRAPSEMDRRLASSWTPSTVLRARLVLLHTASRPGQHWGAAGETTKVREENTEEA